MQGHIAHIILEMITVAMSAFIFIRAADAYVAHLKLGSVNRRDLFYLALFGFCMASINTAHIAVAEFGVVDDLSFFIPATWLLGKMLLSFNMFILYRRPVKLNFSQGIAAGIMMSLLVVSMNLHWMYYQVDSFIGRPPEIVPLVLDLIVFFYITLNKTHLWDNLTRAIARTLVLNFFTQTTMLFSHHIYDTAFTIAHIFAVLAFVPLCQYARYGDKK